MRLSVRPGRLAVCRTVGESIQRGYVLALIGHVPTEPQGGTQAETAQLDSGGGEGNGNAGM